MELPTRFSSQGLYKLFTVFLLGTKNAVGGITDIPEHLPVFLLGTEKGKKTKMQKDKKKYKKDKKYKRQKKSPTRQNKDRKYKDKITHTWQGAQRAATPSAGARTRGP